ncbi:hypothetical protein GIY11_04650 [Aerococcaceae bacterium DSM 109653]|uniref:Uncharacterized protein n=1 Tax=Fundicoccus ignavus TaxID=2664442 RepID=A0A6I2GSV2_9LACT|nr:NfeD family protein [Fundicoccus ignavus]MRI81301.1 hypothetical protein [Fundicoccus ignavus]MRI86535.1 hypothetical protein [Fundicoccus ignavus]
MWILLLIGVALLSMALFLNPKLFYITASIISFGVYFGVPQIDVSIFLVFLLGISLLIVELYVPDFGVIGIVGFLAMVLAIYLKTGDFTQLVYLVLGSIAVAFIVIVYFLKSGKDLNISPGFVLNEAMSNEKGYSSEKDYSFLVNTNGLVISDLRPVGRAKFGEDTYEVISTAEMISSGELVTVVRVQGAKVYVKREGA